MTNDELNGNAQDSPGSPRNHGRVTLTESEFCQAVGISRVHCWRLRRAGKIAHCKVGTRILFLPRHIEEFLAACERKAERGRTR
ncbi:MAG: helix-turn-helix domain-containing protein [Acidobacteria bacterium]|nr:helix-turn-helix domain-containing protein [Acidobacteriota bacterium]MCW5968700.1 helix-turn-helix domain-containing protein [Blastocatellales bacterium]